MYYNVVQRNRQEFKESLEFSEAERTALAEANTEMDVKISTLTSQLTEAKQLYEARYVNLLYSIQGRGMTAWILFLESY